MEKTSNQPEGKVSSISTPRLDGGGAFNVLEGVEAFFEGGGDFEIINVPQSFDCHINMCFLDKKE